MMHITAVGSENHERQGKKVYDRKLRHSTKHIRQKIVAPNMTGCVFVAPGRSHLSHFQTFRFIMNKTDADTEQKWLRW